MFIKVTVSHMNVLYIINCVFSGYKSLRISSALILGINFVVHEVIKLIINGEYRNTENMHSHTFSL